MKIILILLLGALVLAAGWVRLAPSNPEVWHVDPETAPDPTRPNFARLQPGSIVVSLSPNELSQAVEAAMLAMPRTRLLAGSVEDAHMTFVTRSAVWGFPDYTSIRVLPAPGGSTLSALARARFGQSDLGVNAARLEALRTALSASPE